MIFVDECGNGVAFKLKNNGNLPRRWFWDGVIDALVSFCGNYVAFPLDEQPENPYMVYADLN